jgi:hypothetical protein
MICYINGIFLVPTKLCSIAHGLNEECFDLIDGMIMTGQKSGLALVRLVIIIDYARCICNN